MGHLKSLHWGKSFSREQAEEVGGLLPELNLQQPYAIDKAPAALRTYFATYGFDSLLESVTACQYCVGFVQTRSHRLAVHVWQVPNASATVLVSHGLFDHVGLFLGVIEQLLHAGYCVVALDFPGHGLSEGEPAVIRDFSIYASVIEESLQFLMPGLPRPLFAVGQSTGGAALLSYVLNARELNRPELNGPELNGPESNGSVSSGRNSNTSESPSKLMPENPATKVKKLVLLAPLIQPQKWPVINVSYILLHKFIQFIPRNFTMNSHDESFCEFLRDYDPLQPRHISTVWTGAMRKWIQSFDSLPMSNIPCMVIQGDADMTVDWQKNLPRIQNKFSDITIEMIEGGMHHLACEGDAWRSQVYQHMLNFLSKE
ncbi:Monoacylglycerol lipase [Thalassocella blandensis]|nr:Monoacylglycerol lipase [Thalassocella blandensis]